MEPKLIQVDENTAILDARQCGLTDVEVAERLNRALGFETLGSQLESRSPGEGLYIGPREQAIIARMGSIDPQIFVASKKQLQPQQTRALVRKHVKGIGR